jgi:cytochrome oxidase Cu insertion factor (SCO1/SenC/PrrC family)
MAGASFCLTAEARAQEGDHAAHHHDHAAAGEHDHAVPPTSGAYEKLLARYEIPSLELTDQYNRKIRIDKLLSQDRPILVQFIFTSCTTICPIMGAVFGGAQEDVAAISPDYLMVSISIDPEYDTPERMREFGGKQGAGENWILLTGADADIKKVIKAFDVLYQGDNKMYHQPYTFIRWRAKDEWTRLRGLMSVAELTHEFKKASGAE